MHCERTERSGELAFLLEPDLKEAKGGLRDVDAISAIAAAWVAPGPGPSVRAAHGLLLDARHALHEVTGRAVDRLVLQEQAESPGCWNCRTPARCCAAWPGPGGTSLTHWTSRSGRLSAAGQRGPARPDRRGHTQRPGQLAALLSARCPAAAGPRHRAAR
jgi:[protein-PII] uridylyltransferase